MAGNTITANQIFSSWATNASESFECIYSVEMKPLALVVAVCANLGIGKDGKLPWRLSGDMQFFRKVTSETADPARRNAVIMGRKTWDSIPEKFRPLPERVNIVISHQPRSALSVTDAVHVVDSFHGALELVSGPLASTIESVFVIGGSSVYREALASAACQRIYLTRVNETFDCDAFFPEIDSAIFRQTHEEPEVEEKGTHYRICTLERI